MRERGREGEREGEYCRDQFSLLFRLIFSDLRTANTKLRGIVQISVSSEKRPLISRNLRTANSEFRTLPTANPEPAQFDTPHFFTFAAVNYKKSGSMKAHLFLLSFFSLSLLAFSLPLGPGRQFSTASKVEWLSEDTHDFGDIPQKKPARYDFRFRNISGEPLVIDNVRPSCGCTVPNWDAAAVAPDSIGAISIEYDARDLGYFNKKVKVYFHGQRKAEVLYIEGWVE